MQKTRTHHLFLIRWEVYLSFTTSRKTDAVKDTKNTKEAVAF